MAEREAVVVRIDPEELRVPEDEISVQVYLKTAAVDMVSGWRSDAVEGGTYVWKPEVVKRDVCLLEINGLKGNPDEIRRAIAAAVLGVK